MYAIYLIKENGSLAHFLKLPWRKYKRSGPVPYRSTAGNETEWAKPIWWAEYTIQPKTLGKFKGESCVKVLIFAVIPEYTM